MKDRPQPGRARNAPRRAGGFGVPMPLIVGGALLIGLIVIVVLAVMQTINERAAESQPIEGLLTFSNLGGDHQQGVIQYDHIPPAGGPHNPSWLNCGVYTAPVQTEYAVHSLEHGAVWITYQPELASDQVQQLQTLARQSAYRLLSPYPGLPSPIVVSAWGYQLALERADDPRLLQFINRYEQNPNGPEPGATCTGGVGQPG